MSEHCEKHGHYSTFCRACDLEMSPDQAAVEVGRLCNRILDLAGIAGLHVGIKITPPQGSQP